jgi:predicted dehydrogenase
VRWVAAADVVRDHLTTTANRLKIGQDRSYYGPDAYKQLAASKLDAVVIETPPYFHPDHAMEAVNANKHVFLAKPVAVDVPGCKGIVASGEKAAQKNLSYWVDFQTRAREAFQQAAERVHRGDIGKPALAQIFYYAGRVRPKVTTPNADEGLERILNMYTDRVLGGDIIVEQNIHVIDLANWMIGAHPAKACGTGGRVDWRGSPYDAGDAWDHFTVTYWYPNDVAGSFSSNQLNPSFTDLCVRIIGRDGCADLHYNGLIRILGKNPWTGAEKDDTFKGGAIANIKAFITSIRDGKPINNASTGAESTLSAILGRTAAYQNGMETWDKMMQDTTKLEAHLKLAW